MGEPCTEAGTAAAVPANGEAVGKPEADVAPDSVVGEGATKTSCPDPEGTSATTVIDDVTQVSNSDVAASSSSKVPESEESTTTVETATAEKASVPTPEIATAEIVHGAQDSTAESKEADAALEQAAALAPPGETASGDAPLPAAAEAEVTAVAGEDGASQPVAGKSEGDAAPAAAEEVAEGPAPDPSQEPEVKPETAQDPAEEVAAPGSPKEVDAKKAEETSEPKEAAEDAPEQKDEAEDASEQKDEGEGEGEEVPAPAPASPSFVSFRMEMDAKKAREAAEKKDSHVQGDDVSADPVAEEPSSPSSPLPAELQNRFRAEAPAALKSPVPLRKQKAAKRGGARNSIDVVSESGDEGFMDIKASPLSYVENPDDLGDDIVDNETVAKEDDKADDNSRVAARKAAEWSSLRSESLWKFPTELPAGKGPKGSIHLRVFDGNVQVIDLPITDECIVFGNALDHAHVMDATHESVKAQHSCLQFQDPDLFCVQPINGEIILSPVITHPEVLQWLRSEKRPPPKIEMIDPVVCAIGDAPMMLDDKRCCFQLGRSHVVFFVDILPGRRSKKIIDRKSGAGVGSAEKAKKVGDVGSSSSNEAVELKSPSHDEEEEPTGGTPHPKRKSAQNALRSGGVPSADAKRTSSRSPAADGTVLPRMRGWSISNKRRQLSPSPRCPRDDQRRNKSRRRSPKEEGRRKSRSPYRVQRRQDSPQRGSRHSHGRRSRSAQRKRSVRRTSPQRRRRSKSNRRSKSKSRCRRSKSKHRSAKPRRRSKSKPRSLSRQRSKSRRPAKAVRQKSLSPRRSKSRKGKRVARKSRSRSRAGARAKSPVKQRLPSPKPLPKKRASSPPPAKRRAVSPGATSCETDLSESSGSTSALVGRKQASGGAAPKRRAASSSSPPPATKPKATKKVDKKSAKSKEQGKRSASLDKAEVEAKKRRLEKGVASLRQTEKKSEKPSSKPLKVAGSKIGSSPGGPGRNLDDIDKGFGHSVVAATCAPKSAPRPQTAAAKKDADSDATDLEGVDDVATPCPQTASKAAPAVRPPPPQLPGQTGAAAAGADKKGVVKEKKKKKKRKDGKPSKRATGAASVAATAAAPATRVASATPVVASKAKSAAPVVVAKAVAKPAVVENLDQEPVDTREALAQRLMATQKELLRLQVETKTRQLAALRTELQKKQATQAAKARLPAMLPSASAPVMLPAHIAATLGLVPAPSAASSTTSAAPAAAVSAGGPGTSSPGQPVLSPKSGSQRQPGRTSFSKSSRTWISAARASAAAAAGSPKDSAPGGLKTTLRGVVERHSEKVRQQREALEEAQRRIRISGTQASPLKPGQGGSAGSCAASSPGASEDATPLRSFPAAAVARASRGVEIIDSDDEALAVSSVPGLPAPAPVPIAQVAARAAQKTLLQEALDAAKRTESKKTVRQPAVGHDPRRAQ